MSRFAVFDSADAFSPNAVVATSFEEGVHALLLEREALPETFFDLRTGIAGELAQRVALYGVRVACVVPDLSSRSERFREYARESNLGSQLRFFQTRAEAEAWLEAVAP